jgi:hypothetical protein
MILQVKHIRTVIHAKPGLCGRQTRHFVRMLLNPRNAAARVDLRRGAVEPANRGDL